ncbi:MurR/RpiR family transcriptional regulator [Variovorax paradoxus]|uniref:MurR/RpiR family transcriptional regulator n=1 Tax=Variovorax paradoxus TaxID=34073 RepID=UPI0029C7FACD|nr:MurR/RpiR family transcriptional regulator [Variovorax paradoxus]
MKSSPSLFERIEAASSEMTRSERLLAAYLTANARELTLENAASVARKSGVSPMTVGRFLRTLGYESFDEVRREASRLSAPAELRIAGRFEQFSRDHSSVSGVRSAQLTQEIEAMLGAYDLAAGEHWEAMVRQVATSQHVFVAGYQTVRGIASDFAARLEYVREGVKFLDGADGTYSELLGSLKSQTRCLILVDIRRYAKQAEALASAAAEAGVPVFVITDAYCHWARICTPHVFHVQTDVGFFWDSTVAIVGFFNLLMNSVIQQLGKKVGERVSRLEKLQDRFGAFLD